MDAASGAVSEAKRPVWNLGIGYWIFPLQGGHGFLCWLLCGGFGVFESVFGTQRSRRVVFWLVVAMRQCDIAAW